MSRRELSEDVRIFREWAPPLFVEQSSLERRFRGGAGMTYHTVEYGLWPSFDKLRVET